MILHRTLLAPSLCAIALASAAACGDKQADPTPTSTPPAPSPAPAPHLPAPSAPVSASTAGDEEACAQVLVVAYEGAAHAADTVHRTEREASTRAMELRARLDSGADFGALARLESDAASSGPRGGLIGTYARGEWPAAHGAIRDAVFALGVGQVSDVVAADYGFAIARRCPVEKVHTRHILIRYAGAKNAPLDLARDKEVARALASRARADVMREGADFSAIARERSEDGSAARGGDLGNVGRGRLAAAYEAAAFALTPGQVSDVVETEFGFHVIQRAQE